MIYYICILIILYSIIFILHLDYTCIILILYSLSLSLSLSIYIYIHIILDPCRRRRGSEQRVRVEFLGTFGNLLRWFEGIARDI